MNNANQVDANFGFWEFDHRFHNVNFPHPGGGKATPPVNQLLGVNDVNIAVGFYTDDAGNNHGYRHDIERGRFQEINIPGATSVAAAAINNRGDIAGFETDASASGNVDGFVLRADGQLTTLDYPGATMTQALGITAGTRLSPSIRWALVVPPASRGSPGPSTAASRPSMIRAASAPPRSTASTTRASSSGSMSTAPAKPTDCWRSHSNSADSSILGSWAWTGALLQASRSAHRL
jgi:hypothetical protein